MIFKDFLMSLQFLTIINIKNDTSIDEKAFGKMAVLFPLVGALIGILLAITSRLSSSFLPLSISDAIVLTGLIIITGGLHVDGFADSIDGFAGGKDKNDILRIMKDSRIGTFGVVGIVMLLLTKYLSIQSLQTDIKYLTLIAMPVLGRWSVLPMGLAFKYARADGGTGKAFAESVKLKEFIMGTLIALTIILFIMRFKGILMLFVIFTATLIIGRYSDRKINGVTGDVFGAAIEINEMITLILSLLLF
jgi:adenosylcobinamide-GDP ribazoletransferase